MDVLRFAGSLCNYRVEDGGCRLRMGDVSMGACSGEVIGGFG